LTKKNTVLAKFNTVLAKFNTVLTKKNTAEFSARAQAQLHKSFKNFLFHVLYTVNSTVYAREMNNQKNVSQP
jgi:hypothetical protein